LHPRKVITCGEGGFIVTREAALAQQCRRLRNHGLDAQLDMPELGYNYRLTDLQAALALCQLKRGKSLVALRQEKAKLYDQLLAGIDELVLPHAPQGYEHSYQSYVVRLQPKWLNPTEQLSLERLKRCRDAMVEYGVKQGVGLRLAAYAMTDLSYYQRRYGCTPMQMPASLLTATGTIALPIYGTINQEQMSLVARTLKESLRILDA
jgi:dTDP-4-amino-4,6-dideoxygalactose transaminase